jgi:uncharacterized Zn finger protein
MIEIPVQIVCPECGVPSTEILAVTGYHQILHCTACNLDWPLAVRILERKRLGVPKDQWVTVYWKIPHVSSSAGAGAEQDH